MNQSRLGTLLVIILVLIIIGILAWYFTRNAALRNIQQYRGGQQNQQDQQDQQDQQNQQFTPQTFQNNRTVNFIASQPANNQVLNTNVKQVTISFSKDLDKQKSQATVINTNDNSSVTAGKASISNDLRTMLIPVQINQTGNYQVNYTACFVGDDCFNGSFGFTVVIQ